MYGYRSACMHNLTTAQRSIGQVPGTGLRGEGGGVFVFFKERLFLHLSLP